MGPSPPGVESTGTDAGLLSDMKETFIKMNNLLRPSALTTKTWWNPNKIMELGDNGDLVWVDVPSNYKSINNNIKNLPEQSLHDFKYISSMLTFSTQMCLLEKLREEECIRNRQIQEQQEEIARLQNRVETYEIERRKYFAEQMAAQTAVHAVDEWIRVGGMD
jgi:hypothetical protein